MPPRERVADRGRAEGRDSALSVVRELKLARVGHALRQRDVAETVGISASRYSRIERGDIDGLTFIQASSMLATVGLRLRARTYPIAEPIRDAGHVALLGRLRACLHPSLVWRTEVPLPIRGDLRAWDATIGGVRWLVGVEAETRPNDVQALRRRIALKQRDGKIECVILLLADSRHNRRLIREYGADLVEAFPLPGRVALELLGAGAQLPSSTIVLL